MLMYCTRTSSQLAFVENFSLSYIYQKCGRSLYCTQFQYLSITGKEHLKSSEHVMKHILRLIKTGISSLFDFEDICYFLSQSCEIR